MRSLSARVAAVIAAACLCFAVAAAVIGAIGLSGISSATSAGNSISHDELATAAATADLDQVLSAAYFSGQLIALSPDQARRVQVAATLGNVEIPAVEQDLAQLQRLHADDGPVELAGITQLADQWAQLRSALNAAADSAANSPAATQSSALSAAFTPISTHISELIAREDTDATDDQSQASATSHRLEWILAAAVAAAVLLAAGLGLLGSRRLRRVMEPAQDQVEFADTLQLAEDEDEAHRLLQRHLQRTVVGGAVTVLNRNNSADRLEAVTATRARLAAGGQPGPRRAAVVPRGALGTHPRRGRPAPLAARLRGVRSLPGQVDLHPADGRR